MVSEPGPLCVAISISHVDLSQGDTKIEQDPKGSSRACRPSSLVEQTMKIEEGVVRLGKEIVIVPH